MPESRKDFLTKLGAGFLLAAGSQTELFGRDGFDAGIDSTDFIGGGEANDEKFWKNLRKKYYNVSREYINLENGYFGVQSIPVLKSFQKNIEFVNKELSHFARVEYPAVFTAIRKELSVFLQVSEEELIITKNATEALNIAIQGYPFNTGDEVILNQLDYPSVIETFQMLEKRGKIKIKYLELPLLPKNEEEIINEYAKAITEKTRVIMLTHISNVNGLIVPIKRIIALAREKKIDTIVDSAHALGHIPFSIPEMDADFVGMNLHKWIGNPIGAGVLYVNKKRVNEMQPLFGDNKQAENNILKLAHFGTIPFAVHLTIPASLKFHHQLGIQRITERLHHLKNVWISEFQNDTGVEIVTPASLSCGIASFKIKNKPVPDTVQQLMKEFKIFTVARDIGKEKCIRVTPSVYTLESDVRELILAVKKISNS